jgi:hypothetical protein
VQRQVSTAGSVKPVFQWRLGLWPTAAMLIAFALITAVAVPAMAENTNGGATSQASQGLQECQQELKKVTADSLAKSKEVARLDKEVKSGNGFALIVAIGCLGGLWVLLGFIERVCCKGKVVSELAAEKRTTELLTFLLKSRKPTDEILGQVEAALLTSRETKAAQERYAQEANQRIDAHTKDLEKRIAQLEKMRKP